MQWNETAPCIIRERKHGSCCLLNWWDPTRGHRDKERRAVSFVSAWRSLWSRCWQREHLLVNKSIFAKVTVCFHGVLSLSVSRHLSFSLHLFFVTSLLSSCSVLLSVYSTGLSNFREGFLSSVGCSSVCRAEKTTDCRIISIHSHQPDCTVTGGDITAVSGQVTGPACQPRWAPTSPTGCHWPSACMSPPHPPTNTHLPRH